VENQSGQSGDGLKGARVGRMEEGLIYQTLGLDEEFNTPSHYGHVGTGLLRLL